MRRTLSLVAACSLALPALARPQEEPPQWSWEDDAAPPPPADDQASVDLGVGIGTPGASADFSTFRDGLSPYGEWVSVPSYGQVWRPAGVGPGWRPYTQGRWEWTSEGWLWVSDEPFGWATYHYGRWSYDPYYGWVWVPGYQWAPAWVTWRYSPDYVGWAPLAPGFSVYVSAFPVVHSWWTFVPCGFFAGYPVSHHAYAPAYVPRLWAATRPAPPRAAAFGHTAPAWGGPARGFVESRVGHPIAPVRVQPVASPTAMRGAARPGVVPVFRPEGRTAWGGGRTAAIAGSRPGAQAGAMPPARPVAPRGPAPAPGYAPPAGTRYAPPAGTRYAPPAGTRYAPPAATRYAPPAAPGYAPRAGARYAPPAAPGQAPASGARSAPPAAPGYAPPSGARSGPPAAPRYAPPSAPRGGPPAAPRFTPAPRQAPPGGHPGGGGGRASPQGGHGRERR